MNKAKKECQTRTSRVIFVISFLQRKIKSSTYLSDLVLLFRSFIRSLQQYNAALPQPWTEVHYDLPSHTTTIKLSLKQHYFQQNKYVYIMTTFTCFIHTGKPPPHSCRKEMLVCLSGGMPVAHKMPLYMASICLSVSLNLTLTLSLSLSLPFSLPLYFFFSLYLFRIVTKTTNDNILPNILLS